MLIRFLVAIVLTEAVTEIFVASRLFRGLRQWTKTHLPKGNILRYFVKCGYCASVWCGVGSAYLLQIQGPADFLKWGEPLMWGFVIHRASNVLHEIITRILIRHPLTMFLNWNGASYVTKQQVQPSETGTVEKQ